MKPTLKGLKRACPDVNEKFLTEHLKRLDDRYFNCFNEGDICRHVRALSPLTPQQPVKVLVDVKRDGSIDCTVLAFDYPSEFSLITGVLAGMGFSIISGDAFTYDRVVVKPSRTPYGKRRTGRPIAHDPLKRRRIIDQFSGILDVPLSIQTWVAELRENMEAIIGLLERADPGSVNEAKHRVNEMVVKRLAQLDSDSQRVLYPVHMEVDNRTGPTTRLSVVSEDTPAFLYALSNALSLHNISIEHVRIRTIHGRVEDQIDIADLEGRTLEDPDILNRVKLSVLLTKQFTYFLGKAPDPFAALSRFEHLVRDILRLPGRGQWLPLLTNPRTLQHLARVLGASDFLWEDFIRLQYETLLPMFRPHTDGHLFSEPVGTLSARLIKALEGDDSLEQQKIMLNEFKDREIFLIDLDYILNPQLDFRWLAETLTRLAENVVSTASKLIYEHLVKRYGQPMTVGGLKARFAILGLGKLGGAALGYASDVELLFVYSDNGQTDGQESIGNADFYDRMVKGVAQFITAKREGIFHIDLRLRPYGNAGPLACSLESFCRYYGQGGQAHSYERLALVRLRHIGGDTELGKRLERLRDEMVYFSKNIMLQDLHDLREKQFKEKTKGGELNAKFSPGGLVDLEYGVQILQVIHGEKVSRLRTPRIHEALNALSDAGVLSPYETEQLISAYDFLRHLINGLRMLRGSAIDLFLPPVDSDEYVHLARRLGYAVGGPLEPAQQLRFDFEAHTATVRVFWERHFGRDSLPGSGAGTVADLALSDKIPQELGIQILSSAGFKDPARAYVNLEGLAGRGIRRDTFAKIVLLAFDILKRNPDPDRALNNWERFIHAVASPEFHFNLLLSQPMRLEILLNIFAGSQFLADTLVRNPGFLDWVVMPDILHNTRKRKDIEEELRTGEDISTSHREWLDKLRRIRRREILRIGTRDICLGVSTRVIVSELSTLAEALIQVVFEKALDRLEKGEREVKGVPHLKDQFCIMAMGKLGGSELNYSSDVDLVGLWSDSPNAQSHPVHAHMVCKEFYRRLMERIRADLSEHTEEGYAYRVDLRLRPFGSAGELISPLSRVLDYYRDSASLWEIQAALKMRPVGGNLKLGYGFIQKLHPILFRRRSRESIVGAIEGMRQKALQSYSDGLRPTIDVKSGTGGIRDVEFLVQGLQLIYGPETPSIIEGNTMTALDLLREAGILPGNVVEQLHDDYIYLRRTEHYLQILEDRQIHSLPTDSHELRALAKRMMGLEGSAERFMEELQSRMERIRGAYSCHLLEG